MPNHIRHFAIPADDVERARAFYQSAFGWRITPWGPPGFYTIQTGPAEDPGLQGALQQRRIPGAGEGGFECTVGVDDLDAAVKAIEAAGGIILSAPYSIPTVGRLSFFRDTEGNRVGVMQYEV